MTSFFYSKNWLFPIIIYNFKVHQSPQRPFFPSPSIILIVNRAIYNFLIMIRNNYCFHSSWTFSRTTITISYFIFESLIYNIFPSHPVHNRRYKVSELLTNLTWFNANSNRYDWWIDSAFSALTFLFIIEHNTTLGTCPPTFHWPP